MPSPTAPRIWRSKKFIRLMAKSTISAPFAPRIALLASRISRFAVRGWRSEDGLPGVDDGVRDAAARGDGVAAVEAGHPPEVDGPLPIRRERRQRRQDLARSMGDPVGGFRGVDTDDVGRDPGSRIAP